jgi:hypothetical protein
MHARFLELWQAHGTRIRMQISKCIFYSRSRVDEAAVETISDQVMIELWENIAKISVAQDPGDLLSKIALTRTAAWLQEDKNQ